MAGYSEVAMSKMSHYRLVIGDSLRSLAVILKRTLAFKTCTLIRVKSTLIYRVTGCSRMRDRTLWSANVDDRDQICIYRVDHESRNLQ